MRFAVDDRLASARPRGFGDIKTKGIPAWAVMELIASKQLEPVRWLKEEEGYRLVPTATVSTRGPWIVSGLALLATGAYLLYGRFRRR